MVSLSIIIFVCCSKFVLIYSVVGRQDDITASDEMDLLVEQVKMLAGEIAFSTSTLKRLVEQSANDPDASRSQVWISSCPC